MPDVPRLDERRCVVEIIGVAGSGKSTVFEALESQSKRVHGRPHLRAIAGPLQIAVALAAALLTLLARRALVPGAVGEQLRMIAHLRLLPRFFERESALGGIYVFDQGPIFYLTRRILMHPRLGDWRTQALAAWASALDLVVWLDASDAVLAERINAREAAHRLKGTAVDDAVQELSRARSVLRELVEELEAACDRPEILRYDTTRGSTDAVVEAVLRTCSGRRGSG